MPVYTRKSKKSPNSPNSPNSPKSPNLPKARNTPTIKSKNRPKRKALTASQIIDQHKNYIDHQLKRLMDGKITPKEFHQLQNKRTKDVLRLVEQGNNLGRLKALEEVEKIKNKKPDVMANKGAYITKKKKKK